MGVKVTGQFEPAGDFSIVDGADVSGNITGSNVSASGQIEASSIGTKLASIISGSTPFGSSDVSGSWRGELSSSVYLKNVKTTISGSWRGHLSSSLVRFGGDIYAGGDVIAQRYIVSSSVTHLTQSLSSGSTIFGDTIDDTHRFTGSLHIGTGSIETVNHITASGNIELTGANKYISGSSTSTGSVGQVKVGSSTIKSSIIS